MPPRSFYLILLAFVAAILFSAVQASAARVALKSVEASFSEHPADLMQVIDGSDTGRSGWSTFPRVGEPHSLVVQTTEPIHAQAFEVTLCFLSGLPMRYCGDFALAYTTDPHPSLKSKWERAVPQRFNAAGTTLEAAADGHLRASKGDSMIGDAIFQVRMQAPALAVTGFRLDVFPFFRPDLPEPRLAWGEYRDFCLTEFRVEAIQIQTTNVALGCLVSASHPLWGGTPAAVLTDGLPGSYNHPAQSGLGGDFYFQVDLGAVRSIDHFALRGRADGYAMDRMSRVLLRLYAEPPGPGSTPVWEALSRADGSYPGPGEVDIVHASDGRGECRGRYLRISSDSPVALSPQLAEVEAYEVLTVRPILVKADGQPMAMGPSVEVPAGTDVVTVGLSIPGVRLPDRLPVRWRLRGFHDDWQITRDSVAEVMHLRPGDYRFEAQVGHTDGEWNRAVFALPVTIVPHFWQRPAFYWLAAAAALAGGFLAMRHLARKREARRLAALEYQSALAEERSRIARDMHDEVGARLSQLALMQDLVIRQHALPVEATRSLRDLAQNTRQAVDALDQVVWAVNPLHDTLAGVGDYLSQVACSYLEPLNITCRLDVPIHWPEIEVRAQVRHELILAFREALQNVAKHSGAESVTLTIRYHPPDLCVCLADNGRGLPEDLRGVGKDGLRNMQSRLAKIGGVCTITGRSEGGTSVELRAPLAKEAR